MTSPSLKSASPSVEEEALATPKLRTAAPAVTDEQANSPRLRSGAASVYLPPPITSRLRSPAPSAEDEMQANSPRLRTSAPSVADAFTRLWTVPPNWESPVVERLSWRTEVHTSEDATEQRAGWRARPGRSLGYDFQLSEWEVPHAEMLLFALQDQLLGIPVWTDQTKVLAPLGAGATEIPMDPAGLDLDATSLVAVLAPDYGESAYGASGEFYELHQVADVLADRIELAGGLVRGWASGARVVPVRLGYLNAQASLVRPTARGARGSVSAELVDPGWPVLPVLEADEYRGLEVFPFRPDRSQDIEETYTRVRVRRESIGGVLVIEPRRDRPAIDRGLRVVASGRHEIGQLRAWLHRCAGQRKRFWCPSFSHDVDLHRDAAAGHNWLQVRSVRGGHLLGANHGPSTEGLPAYSNPGRRDIEIRATASASSPPIRRRIVAWHEAGEGIDQVLLDEALGAELVAGRAMISWLSEQRIAADQLELSWSTDRLVSTTIPVRSL